MRILLITMPFCTTKWPSLGISLLKSAATEAGFEVDVKYFNLEFARRVPVEWYEEVSLYSTQLMGERLFAEAHFGDRLPNPATYDKRLVDDNSCNQRFLQYMRDFRRHVSPFLKQCLETCDYGTYDVVGFTTMFEQNMASISLARLIKQNYPDVHIVFGGANCSGEMGLELHRLFSCIDYVFRGEADHTFPEFLRRLETGNNMMDIDGLVFRRDNESVAVGSDAVIKDLNALPIPDYDDYFQQLHCSGIASMRCEEIHMETSRGCWWGEKHQCRFCGLNASTICFRSKKPETVIKELDELTERYCTPYGIGRVSMVDNVLDMQYFRSLIPMLEENPPKVDLFFEIKSNLSNEQVKMLSKAGICWVQPGIESLNDHVLKLMNKGVTALQNIRLLKSLKQVNIYPTWNIIYGFPGEKEEDYRNMTNLIYSITHLDPPEGVTALALQRFSPYFLEPKHFGLTNVRPEAAYSYIYPFSIEKINRLAYFFDYDTDLNSNTLSSVKDDFFKAIDHWITAGINGESLRAIEISPYALMIEDNRSSTGNGKILLFSDQKVVYQYLDEMRSLSAITKYIQAKYPNVDVEEKNIRCFLDEMVSLCLVANIGDKYLNLAILEKMF